MVSLYVEACPCLVSYFHKFSPVVVYITPTSFIVVVVVYAMVIVVVYYVYATWPMCCCCVLLLLLLLLFMFRLPPPASGCPDNLEESLRSGLRLDLSSDPTMPRGFSMEPLLGECALMSGVQCLGVCVLRCREGSLS